MPFSPEERALLEPYVTDCERDVFAVRNLNGIVGAVYARYSRAATGFRETLLKEFVEAGELDMSKAQDLIERVLIAFGDDSIGELEGAHVSFENISILATKEIEDRRIGGSPIEKSTRYVIYDQPGPDGYFRYYRDPAVAASPLGAKYDETMGFIFRTYAELVEPMQDYYRGLKPMEEAEYDINGDGVKERLTDCEKEADQKAFRRTYQNDIRTKACDALRYLLPVATLTNVGVFGNGRFFQNVLTHCYTSALPEAQRLAEATHEELNKIIPRYVKRAAKQEYNAANHERMRRFTAALLAGTKPETSDEVELIDRGEAAIAERLSQGPVDVAAVRAALQGEDDALLIAAMLFPYAEHPLGQLHRFVSGLAPEQRQVIVDNFIGERRNRRDRPGRPMETGYPWTFDMLTDFGTYKDLMRHRVTTQLRQKFTPKLGFAVPPDLEAAGFAHRALECRDRAAELYDALLPEFPEQASYATLHGSLVRWVIGFNDREAVHLIELRTTPQGHPSYRKVAQLLHRAMAARSPWRAAILKFVDHNDYFWSRADSEARQRAQERALDEKK
ncbi:MAG: FAD-dependent thymidylate synthase [Patescibacteria group bacterium]|nr:FAD-dependent thymidylate synthase [Patescibacteria group bacterium]